MRTPAAALVALRRQLRARLEGAAVYSGPRRWPLLQRDLAAWQDKFVAIACDDV